MRNLRDSAGKIPYSVKFTSQKYLVDILTFIDTDSKHNSSYIICHIGILKSSSVT